MPVVADHDASTADNCTLTGTARSSLVDDLSALELLDCDPSRPRGGDERGIRIPVSVSE